MWERLLLMLLLLQLQKCPVRCFCHCRCGGCSSWCAWGCEQLNLLDFNKTVQASKRQSVLSVFREPYLHSCTEQGLQFPGTPQGLVSLLELALGNAAFFPLS